MKYQTIIEERHGAVARIITNPRRALLHNSGKGSVLL
jgi:hypothetical protein